MGVLSSLKRRAAPCQVPVAILPSCVKDGASTSLPFVCPLEHLIDVEDLVGIWSDGYLLLRPWTLLNASVHPEASATLLADVAEVVWLRTAEESVEASSRPAAAQGTEGGALPEVQAARPHAVPRLRTARLQRGLSDVQLRTMVEQLGIADARCAKNLQRMGM